MDTNLRADNATAGFVPIRDRWLPDDLAMPAQPRGIVLFAHEILSSRHSRRNQHVARVEVALEIASGATHLFEESGALERVAELAADWFSQYMPPLSST